MGSGASVESEDEDGAGTQLRSVTNEPIDVPDELVRCYRRAREKSPGPAFQAPYRADPEEEIYTGSRVTENRTSTTFRTHAFVGNHIATILCWSAVLKRYMVNWVPPTQSPGGQHCNNTACFIDPRPGSIRKAKPSLDEIRVFVGAIYADAQLDPEVLIVALIYLERVLRRTNGRLKVCPATWRPLVVTVLILASKYHDDCSMINENFAYVLKETDFTLTRINKLELVVVTEILKFDLNYTLRSYGAYAKALLDLHDRVVRIISGGRNKTKKSHYTKKRATRLADSPAIGCKTNEEAVAPLDLPNPKNNWDDELHALQARTANQPSNQPTVRSGSGLSTLPGGLGPARVPARYLYGATGTGSRRRRSRRSRRERSMSGDARQKPKWTAAAEHLPALVTVDESSKLNS